MKQVLIIYTGGTIGMTRTENGYAPRAATSAAALDGISEPAFGGDARVGFSRAFAAAGFVQYDGARVEPHRALIAQKYNDYDGFVVLHGTDTMAYTASALSFMLGGLDKPVVLTARRSLYAKFAATGATTSSPRC